MAPGVGSGRLSAAFGRGTYDWRVIEERKRVLLANPRGYIPGTAMSFAGLSRDQQRADVIAYLRTLADSPKPLPPVAEGGAKPAEGGAKPAEAPKH